MTDPTSTGSPNDATLSPAAAKAKKSEEARKRREPKKSRRVLVVLAVAGLLFAGAAAWIASQPLPYVTHREILELATAIEATKNSEQLLRYFDRTMFDNLAPEAAAMVTKFRDDPSITYTFITVADERTKRPRLLFRLHKSYGLRMGPGGQTVVTDYQEMVADRIDGVVKVVDLRSLLGGDMWVRALAAQSGPSAPPPSLAMASLFQAAQSRDQVAALAAFQALSPEERALVPSRVALLASMDTRAPEAFGALSREVRTWYPENLSPALHVLIDAQFATPPIQGQLRDDVRAAIGRIQMRIPDDAWLGAFARAMLTTPPEDPK